MPEKIDQREAMKKAFINLCQQYQQIGEQLKTFSLLITPYLNGAQDLVPEMKIELYSEAEQAILQGAQQAAVQDALKKKGPFNGQEPPKT